MAPRQCEATVANLGLPRTGTTSLHEALLQLGVHSQHPGAMQPDDVAVLCSAAMRMRPAASVLDPTLTKALGEADAVSCWPWALLAVTHPAALHAARPALKLVATTRAIDAWVPSAQWLFGDPLFRYGHPEPTLALLRRFFDGWPSADADFRRTFRRHQAAVAALNASLVDLSEPAPARWRTLCSLLLAPPAPCTTPVLRSMADCPLASPWPLRSERHNNLEVLGLSGQQASALGLMQDDERQWSADAALEAQVERDEGWGALAPGSLGWIESQLPVDCVTDGTNC